ncbi:hypothetical protein ACK3OH_004532 [Salmonella enterica]
MANNTSAIDSIQGYFDRNRWMVIVIGVAMINASMLIGVFFIDSSTVTYSVISGCVRAISILALIYAGVLNIMANTISARVFRMIFIVGMLAGFIAFILKTLNLY